MKIMIGAGGTGGHLFPAMAVLEQLEILTNGNLKASFVGTPDRIESRVVPSKGYDFTPMPISGFAGISLKSLALPFKIMKSIPICKKLIKEFKPDAVLCTGAYISYPAGAAASSMNVPLFLMESNVNPGKTIKVLSKKATKIFTSFEKTKTFFPLLHENIVEFTGNPVRKNLLDLPSQQSARKSFQIDEHKSTVLILGGSLGARSINSAVEKNFNAISNSNLQFIWQTGKSYNLNKKMPQNIKKFEFIEDMASAYAAADIVVSRSGATSVAEICVCGKPSILIPLPSASNNEQYENGLALEQAKATWLIKDSDASGNLFNKIFDLAAKQIIRDEMSKNTLKLSKPDAAKVCAGKILDYLNK